MCSDGSITRWIAELELGYADEAQEAIWQRYFKRLLGFAKIKLGETSRGMADEEDVAVAALQSFFGGMAKSKFPRLHDRTQLWPLLAKITSRKAIDQRRREQAEKRGGKYHRINAAQEPNAQLTVNWEDALAVDDLEPESLIEIAEECDRLLALLADDELRTIAQRKLEGYANAEIASELGVVERTVERRLQLIRAHWEHEIKETRL